MADSFVSVENGSTLSDYDLATDSRTWAGGSRHVPLGVIADRAANTLLSIVAEDAALAGGETGILALGQRLDTRAAPAGTSGDAVWSTYSAQGAQYVEVARRQVIVDITISGLTNVAYAAGDVLGTIMSSASFARYTAGSGRVTGAVMVDAADVMGAVDLFLFDTTVSPGADNAAFNPSDADMLRCLGVIQLPAPFDAGSNRVATWAGSVPFVCTSASTTVFIVAVTRSANGAHPSATGLTFRFIVEQD